MKNYIRNLFSRLGVVPLRAGRRWVLPALVGVLLIPAGRVTAQIFTYGPDGANPAAALILSGQTLYGTALYGGSNSGNGTVFAVGTNGTGFTSLHSFTATSTSSSGLYTNTDGASPYAGLITNSSGGTLYGATFSGGSSSHGTVFAVNTDGTGFTNLHSFSGGSDGANPYAGLISSGGTLYGTATAGGSAGYGTVFAVNADGTGFTNLHSFTATSTNSSDLYTNTDGASPYAGLILSGNTLYGTASYGGSSGNGTVFAVNTDGTGFTNLHSFAATSGPSSTNSDGANPLAGLILSGNTLYGTAGNGGSSGRGTVFAVNTDATGFRILHSFTNSDGAYPLAGLILSGNTLYGTAYLGGSSGIGTVFALNTDGTRFTNLHSFQATLQGPQLTISLAGSNVLLMWPSAFEWTYSSIGQITGFYTYRLQSTTSPGPSAVWTTVYPAPIIVNGQKILANPSSGTQQFYRLILQHAGVYPCDFTSHCPCGFCAQFDGFPEWYCAYPDGSPCDYY